MSEEKKTLTVAEELSAIHEQLKTLFSSVQEIKSMIHGDGKTGLIPRVTALETLLDATGRRVDDTKKETTSAFSWIAWAVTTAVAAYAAFFKHSN